MHEWPKNNVRKELLIIHIHIINYVIKTNFPVNLLFSNQSFLSVDILFVRKTSVQVCKSRLDIEHLLGNILCKYSMSSLAIAIRKQREDR